MHRSPIRVELSCQWTISDAAGGRCDARLFRALEAIREAGSLTQAARALGLSYRHLWGRLRDWSALFGAPLATLEKGRGARLTPLADRLLQLHGTLARGLDARLAAASERATARLRALMPEAAPRLRLFASHDALLARLRDLAADGGRVSIDLQFRGSLEALAALVRGECDLAGFHVAASRAGDDARERVRQLLPPGRYRVVELMQRTQGLIVARGNPKRLRSVADLARRGVVFVNRQAGSGTRLLLDALLHASGISPESIRGYDHAEFTHDAVAATVASGMADAGLGIRAATVPLGLGFVAIDHERYYLAARTASFATPACSELLKLARGARLRAAARQLPGYVLRRRLEPAGVRHALGAAK